MSGSLIVLLLIGLFQNAVTYDEVHTDFTQGFANSFPEESVQKCDAGDIQAYPCCR